MRYLYADSEPFPLEYDFLATLRALMRAAAQSYAHLARIEELDAEMDARNVSTQSVLGAIAEFTGAMEAARSAATEHFTQVAEVAAFSAELEGHLSRSSEAAREACARGNEDTNQTARSEADGHRKSMRTLLEDFVLGAQLGMEMAHGHILMRPDERYEVEVGGWTEGPIEVDFGVTTDRLPEWKEPRRVETMGGSMILQVGMKKKFLSKSMTRELMDVSDYTLGEARVHPRGAEIHLRRKPTSNKEVVVLLLSRSEAGLTGTVSRLDHEGGAPFGVAGEDLPKVERLWQNIEQAVRAALPKHNSVRGVRLDGQDALAQDLAPRVFDRLIERFAPLVHEIAKRSPSVHELSLKLERDDGRREELYQRKAELAEELKALDPRMRARFVPLGFGQ